MIKPGVKYRIQRTAVALGFGGAGLLLIAAIVADRGFGQDVLVIAPSDPYPIMPRITCRIVRPLEMRVTNNPTNGP